MWQKLSMRRVEPRNFQCNRRLKLNECSLQTVSIWIYHFKNGANGSMEHDAKHFSTL